MSTDRRMDEVKPHILLTGLGTSARSVTYSYQGASVEARLAPVALFHCLAQRNQQPTEIVALCTKEAQTSTFAYLAQDLAGECPVRSVSIPAEDDPEAPSKILEIMAKEVPKAGSLSVEFTQGPRSFSLLILIGAMQLVALRDRLELRNVYYASQNGPISDLGIVLELSKWIRAANSLTETGSALQVARMLDQDNTRPGRSDQNRQRLVTELENISRAFADGLPLELGQEVGGFLRTRLKSLRKHIVNRHNWPHVLSHELVDKLQDSLQPFAAQHDIPKKDIELTRTELQRQADLIDRLYEVGHLAAAFGLMREWVVSWAMWNSSEHGKLCDPDRRKKAERQLGLIAKLRDEGQADTYLTPSQRDVAEFWKQLRDVRNLAHHHGMGGEGMFDRKLESVKDRVFQLWSDRMRCMPTIDLKPGTDTKYRKLIVSPLGHSPGVLFSAIRTIRNCAPADTRNDMCAVIASEQTRGEAREALAQAGFEGEVCILEFQDAFAGVREIQGMLAQTRTLVLEAEDTHVNITGGTTLMGLLAEKIAIQARDYQRLGSRFMLIDQRPPEEQRAAPYEMGQKFVLD